jgi:glycosyltransferase involved in cell wall biosynthesis
LQLQGLYEGHYQGQKKEGVNQLRNLREGHEIMQNWRGDISKPLVSICCITYNHEKFIEDAMEGFLIQETDFPFEILIHDDASTDKTADIIREYEEKYPDVIKAIYQKENQYSKGIKPSVKFNYPRAKGKYIALCEGDDYWTDNVKLQKQVAFLEANPDYVVSYHDAKIVDETGNLIANSKMPGENQRDFSSDELMKGAWLLTLSMCFRNVLKDFPEELSKVLNGDIFLISLLGAYGRGKYQGVETRPAVYRKQSGSIWSSMDKTDQIFHNANTFSWLYRYYKKLSQEKLADYFKLRAISFFAMTLKRAALSERHRYKNLVSDIFTNYKDIINGTYEKQLIELTKGLGYQFITAEAERILLRKELLGDTLRSYETGNIDEAERFLASYIKQFQEANL